MYEFHLPDVGEGLHEAEIGAWLVAEGESVRQDQPLLEIETDKATVEIPAPVAGKIVRQAVETGAVAQVGDLLVVIEPESKKGQSDSPSDPKSAAASGPASDPASGPVSGPAIGIAGPGERILASPVARRMALEKGVDLRQVAGSGPAGRIMTADVEAAAEAPAPAPSPAEEASPPDAPTRPLAAPAVRKRAEELGIALADVPGSASGGRVTLPDLEQFAQEQSARPPRPARPLPAADGTQGEPVRLPLRGVRRTIARRMEEAWRIPQVTSFAEFDASRLVAVRQSLRALAEARGARLTFLPLIAKAVAVVLQEQPNLNAALDLENEEILQHPSVHLGIATATDAGLLVPVVRGAERLSVLEIAQEIERLAAGAQERTLPPEELSGSTFTITNFGSYGSEMGTPILNPPEAAILGIGRIAKRPVVTPEDGIAAQFTLPLALTIDHRLLDGADAGRFLARLEELLTRPEALLLELR